MNSVSSALSSIQATQKSVLQVLEKLVTEDAAVQAVVTDLQAQNNNLVTLLQSVASTVAALLSEIGTGTGNVSAATLASLQAVQQQIDATVAAGQQQAASEAAEVPPPPA